MKKKREWKMVLLAEITEGCTEIGIYIVDIL